MPATAVSAAPVMEWAIPAGGQIAGDSPERSQPAESQPAESQPAQGARFVAFGDSHASGRNLPMVGDDRGCEQGVASWPRNLAGLMGVLDTPNFIDATCSGSAIDTGIGWLLADQVKWAQKRSALGPDTELVVLQFGVNDKWGNDAGGYVSAVVGCLFLVNGCPDDAAARGLVPDASATTGENFASRIEQVIAYIKYYAPNARIALVSIPEMTPQRGDEICATLLGVEISQPKARPVVDWLAALAGATRDAAQILDLDFVDAHGASSGHGPCTQEPWVNGIYDSSNPAMGPLHNNVQGDRHLAELVLNTLEL